MLNIIWFYIYTSFLESWQENYTKFCMYNILVQKIQKCKIEISLHSRAPILQPKWAW
jgi:hypothetical protein